MDMSKISDSVKAYLGLYTAPVNEITEILTTVVDKNSSMEFEKLFDPNNPIAVQSGIVLIEISLDIDCQPSVGIGGRFYNIIDPVQFKIEGINGSFFVTELSTGTTYRSTENMIRLAGFSLPDESDAVYVFGGSMGVIHGEY